VDLSALLERAASDSRFEEDFFRELPDGTVYVHAPLSDDHPALRLIVFKRPDGLMVLPVFTSYAKAEEAAQNAVRILTMTGRALEAMMSGATWMIDPNDRSCTLYPDELASLMLRGELRSPITSAEVALKLSEMVDLGPPPEALAEDLRRVFRNLQTVRAAYLVGHPERRATERVPYLLLAVDIDHAEQAVRSTAAVLMGYALEESPPIEIVTVVSDAEIATIVADGTKPFFRRPPHVALGQ
jgi:hypothetical protein